MSFIIEIDSNLPITQSWANSYIDQVTKDFIPGDDDVENIAEMVRQEQGLRIDRQRNRFDGGLRPLASSTVRKKGSSKALFNTGVLRDSFVKRKIKDGWVVTVAAVRKVIAGWLNSGTKKMRPFEFFGAEENTQLSSDIEAYFKRKVNFRRAG